MTAIHIPAAPDIPGLWFRTYAGEVDVPEMARVMNAATEANGNPEFRSESMVRNELDHASSTDPHEDVVLAFVEEELVAVSEVLFEDANEGMRHYQSYCYVHPDWRGRGLGSALLPRAEARLRRIAAKHRQPAPPLLVTWTDGPDVRARALVQAHGYRAVRTYHMMVRPDLDDIEAPAPPEGIVIRPVTRDELRQVWDAMSEAFRDHFGAMDTSETAFQGWISSPRMDPDGVICAFDGDEVVAGVQAAITPGESEARGYRRGWTDPVFTRRAWRRRGLAHACLGRALSVLRDWGMTSAQLGVDTENPNDALTLYRKHRFESTMTETEWHKPLELE
ncbi:MAG: GNAT family N-acetyltransferase [Candidatus Limnocylindrales bacterium]